MKKNEGGGKTATDNVERKEALLRKKLKQAEKPDSVVIIPCVKPQRFAMVNMLLQLDRIVRTIKRRSNYRLSRDDVEELMAEVRAFVDRLWSEMTAMAPYNLGIRKEEWRCINDPVDVRLKNASIPVAFVFVPSSRETGQAAMAVKVIEKRIDELRWSLNTFDRLEEAVQRYKRIRADFDSVLKSLSESLGIKYRPLKRDGTEN